MLILHQSEKNKKKKNDCKVQIWFFKGLMFSLLFLLMKRPAPGQSKILEAKKKYSALIVIGYILLGLSNDGVTLNSGSLFKSVLNLVCENKTWLVSVVYGAESKEIELFNSSYDGLSEYTSVRSCLTSVSLFLWRSFPLISSRVPLILTGHWTYVWRAFTKFLFSTLFKIIIRWPCSFYLQKQSLTRETNMLSFHLCHFEKKLWSVT